MKYLYSALIIVSLSGISRAQQFQKVTSGPVVETPSGSRACIFIDFNNDTFLDIFISNGTSGGEDNLLYMNNGDGTFTAQLNDATDDFSPSDGACAADVHNDGWVDLAVVNWYGDDNLLYSNASNSTGTLISVDTGIVVTDGGFSEAASWADYDNDGWVDLYVTNSAGNKRNFLYKNLGDGSFEKVVGIEPTTDPFLSRSVNWVDVDGDSDLDLFVSNESNQKNNLYINDGNGGFAKLTNDTLVSDNFNSFTSSWCDIDNDGDFDVFIGNYQAANQLFLNDGSANFTAVSGPWDGTSDCTFSSSFADYDNDGFKDLFVTNGYCNPDLTNALYHNNGDGTFSLVSNESVATDVGGSYGCAWGDYNNDGNLDLMVANWQNEAQENYLYENLGIGNNWLKINLEGTVSNFSAIGAVVRCLASINGVDQWQTHQLTTQSGYCSQNSLVAHFGLGSSQIVDSIIVDWPSGISDTLTDVSGNTFYTMIEGGDFGVAGIQTNRSDFPQLRVFPNPTDGTEVSIAFSPQLHATGQVELLSVTGKLIKSTDHILVESEKITLDAPFLDVASGTYLLRISFEEGEVIETIQVE